VAIRTNKGFRFAEDADGDGVVDDQEDPGALARQKMAEIEAQAAAGDPLAKAFVQNSGRVEQPLFDPIDLSIGIGTGFLKSFAGAHLKVGSQELGAIGEEAAGVAGSKVRIPSLSGTAKYRVPDQLTDTALTEVKNTARVSFTNQLRDFH